VQRVGRDIADANPLDVKVLGVTSHRSADARATAPLAQGTTVAVESTVGKGEVMRRRIEDVCSAAALGESRASSQRLRPLRKATRA